jgi:hypothetical protein
MPNRWTFLVGCLITCVLDLVPRCCRRSSSTMLEQLQVLDGHEQIVATFIVAVLTFITLMLFGEEPKLRRTGFSVILPGDEFIHRGPECPDEVSFCRDQEQ